MQYTNKAKYVSCANKAETINQVSNSMDWNKQAKCKFYNYGIICKIKNRSLPHLDQSFKHFL